MVKIELEEPEAQAVVVLINDCQVKPEMGYALTMLKMKIIQAFQKANKDKLAEELIGEARGEEEED